MIEELGVEVLKETREEQVIRFAADGYTDKEIAQNLGLSIDTVSTYWRRILVKTGCSSRTQVIAQVTKQKSELQMRSIEREREIALNALKDKEEAEHNLRVERERLKAVIEEAPFAMVFENTNGRVDFINQHVIDLFGFDFSREEVEGASAQMLLNSFMLRVLDPSAFANVGDELKERSASKDGIVTPLRNGKYVESLYRPLYANGEQFGHLWVYKDVTDAHLFNLADGNQFLAYFTAVGSKLLRGERANVDQIEDLLLKIGEYRSADRTFIFEFNSSKTLCSNTFEWTQKGISSEKNNLQDLPCSVFSWATEKMFSHQSVYLDEISQLPAEASVEAESLRDQGIKSNCMIPLIEGDSNVIGFWGADYVRNEKQWTATDKKEFEWYSNLFVGLLRQVRNPAQKH